MKKQTIFRFVRTLAAVIVFTAGAAFSAFAGKASALSEPYAVRTPGTEINHTENRPAKHQGHFYRHLVRETTLLLNVEQEAIITELRQGKTLLQIAKEKKGWSEAEYERKLTASITAKIDKSVQEGKLSQEKADKFKTLLPGKIQKAVNRKCKDNPHKSHKDTGYNTSQNQVNQKPTHP